jgi:hypothetical protein
MDPLPDTKTWLSSNWKKITLFWLHAEWRAWARYDLYAHLEGTGSYRVQHGVPLWDGDSDTVVDLTVSTNGKDDDVAIWLCTAKPGENDTSFGDFVEKFKKEWNMVKGLVEKYGGGELGNGKSRLLFLGIGEKAYEEEDLDFGGLRPESFGYGGSTEYEASLSVYYLWLDLPEDD